MKSVYPAKGKCPTAKPCPEKDQLLEELRTIPFFKDLEATDLEKVTQHMKLSWAKVGEQLLVQGEPVSSIYFIKQGVVDVLVNEDRVAQRVPMDPLGEMSCLTGEEFASATIITVTPCQVWEISRENFLQIIEIVPNLQSRIISTITQRLKVLSHRFSEILKHIPHGIIKVDLDGRITDEYSSRCIDYLGYSDLSGRKLGDILFAESEGMKRKWEQVFRHLSHSHHNQYNKVLNLLPEELSYQHPDGEIRFFKLFFHLATDNANHLTGLDIGIDDITQNRHYQNDLSSFENMVTSLEQLLILIDAESGLIYQETFSHSHLGQIHFPTWKNLKGKSIFNTILNKQYRDQEQIVHFRRWLKMLFDPFCMQSMKLTEIEELSPKFIFETVTGKVVELSFSVSQRKSQKNIDILGKFSFMENEQQQQQEENQFSTIELMEEVMMAQKEHDSDLPPALNEIQVSLEIVQTQMITPNSLVINQRQIRRMIHSVKGLAQSLGLLSIARAAHEVEDHLDKTLESGQKPTINDQLLKAFRSLLSLIVLSKSLCDTQKSNDFGVCRNREPEIHIPYNRYRQIKQKMDKILSGAVLKKLNKEQSALLAGLRNEVASFELTNLAIIFPRLERIIKDTGKLLHKEVEFKIADKDPVHVDVKIGHVIFSCLIQMVKNAVFHGAESVSERRFLGKLEKARIDLAISRDDEFIAICLSDDGRGINLEKTVKRAFELELIDQDEKDLLLKDKNEDQILQLLFKPGFSTAGSISLISGRGIGMSMIKSEIETIGGNVRITSRENRGTDIYIKIPAEPMENLQILKDQNFQLKES